jgi:excisionase family DNA binding protein
MRGSLPAIRSSTHGAVMAKRQELNVSLRYVSSRVASEILGVQAQTLRRWAKAGKIGAIRTPGNQWRYDLSGLIVAPAPAAPPPKPKKAKPAAQVDLEDIIAATPPPQVLPGVQMAFAVDPIMPSPPMGPDLRAQIERLSSSSRW